jgi:hypothetical protein
MRSKLSCLAAAMIMCGALSSAHGADPKKGAAKKKSTEQSLDNFDKQMQWENNVMGPDDKKADMARLARANALAKAAAEKAATEKAAAEKQAAKEEATRKPATKTAAPVLLATPEDENAGKSTKSRGSDDHEVSPKLSTEEAMAPPPPVKPADDKFIDKLLKGEPGKKKVVRNDDKLDDLLAKDKIASAPKPRGKRADSVDDLLKQAEKAPDMVVTKAKTPEWAKIDAPAAAPPPPVVPRQQPKRDDGVIHVVQGAASASNNPRPQMAAAPSRRAQNADTFDRRDATDRRGGDAMDRRGGGEAMDRRGSSNSDAADPFDAPRGRRNATTSSRPASFSDPFADGAPAPAPRSRVAPPPPPPRPAPPAPRAAVRREPAAAPAFHDPFGDPPAPSKTVKRTPETKPAGRPGGFKDPFSDAAPVHKKSSMVALGDSHRKDDVTAKQSTASSKAGNWAVLKQSRR